MGVKDGNFKSEFYLVANPLSDKDESLYVFHNRSPRFIASVSNIDNNITIDIVLQIDSLEGFDIEVKKNQCKRYVIAYYTSLDNYQQF